MTEPKFRREFKHRGHLSCYLESVEAGGMGIVEELERCYALLDKAVAMAEFYGNWPTKVYTPVELPDGRRVMSQTENFGDKAREFLKAVSK